MKMTRIEVERIEPLHKSICISPARDQRLSYKARGILYYLLTKPEGWKGQLYDLVQQSNEDGIKAIRSALKELVKYGYAELIPYVDTKTGKFSGKFYRFSDYSKKPPKN
jgi:hypothetical protein